MNNYWNNFFCLCSVWKKKNSLPSKHCPEDEAVDRISRLPDYLIHEILSSIDIRYAVQTSVLSKRWRNVWKSLPYIRSNCMKLISDKLAEETDDSSLFLSVISLQNTYIGFVNKVFEFRDESDIQMINLELVILDEASVEALNRWIVAAVNHNVQQVIIIIGYTSLLASQSAYEIPHQLLNCRSLKKLKVLFGNGLSSRDTGIILPDAMSLPQIKELTLRGISISNSELQRLISSCPLMEILSIQECEIQKSNQGSIIIDSHNLRGLDLFENRHTYLGSADDFFTYSTTKICAPNFIGLFCTGLMTEDFSIENLSSLIGAHFNMRFQKEEADETAETYSDLPAVEKEVLAKRMLRFIGAVQNVQILILSSGFLEVLLQAPGTLYRQPPQLCNLEHLKLEMRFTSGCLRSIAFLLKISPKITILELKSKESNLADVGDDWEAGFSQTCIFSHLKFVLIREVEGCDNELKLLRFLLKKSMVLEKLYLFFRSTGDSLDRRIQLNRFKKNLEALPTVSSSIQMYFLKGKLHD